MATAAKKASGTSPVVDPEPDDSELDGADESPSSGRPALAYAAYGH